MREGVIPFAHIVSEDRVVNERVAAWVQEGRLYAWRYRHPNRGWSGWHFSADPLGCRSVGNLLGRMHKGEPCHRTLNLQPVTEAILSVPNYGRGILGQFGKLRLNYRPQVDQLQLCPEGDRLTMTIGDRRLPEVAAAFAEVETGGGDFGIATSDDRNAENWMFWWVAGINYCFGNRS